MIMIYISIYIFHIRGLKVWKVVRDRDYVRVFVPRCVRVCVSLKSGIIYIVTDNLSVVQISNFIRPGIIEHWIQLRTRWFCWALMWNQLNGTLCASVRVYLNTKHDEIEFAEVKTNIYVYRNLLYDCGAVCAIKIYEYGTEMLMWSNSIWLVHI